MLALFGVPVARDLRGRVLLSAFEPDVVDAWTIAFGASRRPDIEPDNEAFRAIPSPTDDLLEERLRALGYIE